MDAMMKINYDYDAGRITGNDAACKVLAILELENVEHLEQLTDELRDELSRFIDGYRPEARSTSHQRPSEAQVQLAKTWLERTAKM